MIKLYKKLNQNSKRRSKWKIVSDESTIFFFFYLWLSCRYLWKVLVPCSSLRRDSRERERKREGCAENVYIYSWYGVGLKWGYREEKGFCFVYLGSGHECWVSVSDYELWLILGVTRISNRLIDLISDHFAKFFMRPWVLNPDYLDMHCSSATTGEW